MQQKCLIRVYTVCCTFSRFLGTSKGGKKSGTCLNFRTDIVWNKDAPMLRVNTGYHRLIISC